MSADRTTTDAEVSAEQARAVAASFGLPVPPPTPSTDRPTVPAAVLLSFGLPVRRGS